MSILLDFCMVVLVGKMSDGCLRGDDEGEYDEKRVGSHLHVLLLL